MQSYPFRRSGVQPAPRSGRLLSLRPWYTSCLVRPTRNPGGIWAESAEEEDSCSPGCLCPSSRAPGCASPRSPACPSTPPALACLAGRGRGGDGGGAGGRAGQGIEEEGRQGGLESAPCSAAAAFLWGRAWGAGVRNVLTGCCHALPRSTPERSPAITEPGSSTAAALMVSVAPTASTTSALSKSAQRGQRAAGRRQRGRAAPVGTLSWDGVSCQQASGHHIISGIRCKVCIEW